MSPSKSMGKWTPDPRAAGFDPDRLEALGAYFADLVSSGEVVGAVGLVSRRGQVAMHRAWGLSDRNAGAAMRPDSIFRIYSQTKLVTAVAMMILHERGAWDFPDLLEEHIPQFRGLQVLESIGANGELEVRPPARAPTLADLMTYTAGFTYGLNEDDPLTPAYQARNPMGSASLAQMIDKLAGLPLAFDPGTQWRYGLSSDIQGYLVERLSGQNLPDFMASNIFGPLGMDDTGFHLPAGKLPRVAAIYQHNPDGPPTDFPPEYVFDISQPPPQPLGGAGLVSTALDYARLCQMLLSDGELEGVRVLSEASVRSLRTNHLAEGTPLSNVGLHVPMMTPGMGFGLSVAVIVDPAKAATPVGTGTFFWGGAAGSWFWVDPANDLYAVGMIHSLRYPDNMRMGNRARTALYGALG